MRGGGGCGGSGCGGSGCGGSGCGGSVISRDLNNDDAGFVAYEVACSC